MLCAFKITHFLLVKHHLLGKNLSSQLLTATIWDLRGGLGRLLQLLCNIVPEALEHCSRGSVTKLRNCWRKITAVVAKDCNDDMQQKKEATRLGCPPCMKSKRWIMTIRRSCRT